MLLCSFLRQQAQWDFWFHVLDCGFFVIVGLISMTQSGAFREEHLEEILSMTFASLDMKSPKKKTPCVRPQDRWMVGVGRSLGTSGVTPPPPHPLPFATIEVATNEALPLCGGARWGHRSERVTAPPLNGRPWSGGSGPLSGRAPAMTSEP